jgi:polygalacturonase
MNDTHSQVFTRRKWLSAAATPALAAALLPLRARGADAPVPAAQEAGARVYNIRDFGAKGDGTTLDGAALQSAIDACNRDGGGTVLVPAGNFVIGTTELKSNVTLHIAASATLLGSGSGKDYHAVAAIPLNGDSTLGDGNWALLFAVNAKNITVEGPGTIDGQGQLFNSYGLNGKLPPAGISGAQRPYHLLFHRCENIVVRDLDLLRCAFHSIRVIQSERVRMEGLYIHNRVTVNNDGFHFISARFVTISNCVVLCQDDACALFGSCQFVTVTNCVFSTRWSVFRFGGGNVKNIAVSNCLIYETYGCPIKVGAGRMQLENLSFSNLILQDVTGPISINFTSRSRNEDGGAPSAAELEKYDMNKNGRLDPEELAARRADRAKATAADTPPPADAPVAFVRNISFSNIRATVVTEPTMSYTDMSTIGRVYPGEQNSCITLNGTGEAWIENVSFDDVHVTYAGGGTAELAAKRDIPMTAREYFGVWADAPVGPPAYGLFARNVKGLTLHNVRFSVAKPDLRPAVVLDNVRDAAIHSLNVEGNPQAESVLRFSRVQDALLSASRVLTPSGPFLQIEGTANANVIVDGGDLTKATKPLAVRDGATESAVKIRG